MVRPATCPTDGSTATWPVGGGNSRYATTAVASRGTQRTR